MKKSFLIATIFWCLSHQVFPIPANVTAFFRDGQTFITWTEDGSGTYDIYRSESGITSGNIVSATKVGTVNSQSSNTVYNIGSPIGQTHWIIQPLESGMGLGTELTDSDGLFVHTTQETAGDFYYAVCSGGTTTISGNAIGPVSEQRMVTKPIPIWRGNDGDGRLNIHYTQFMDYTIWNTQYEGYMFNFVVSFPSSWDTASALGVVFQISGRGTRLPQTIALPSNRNIAMMCECVTTSSDLQDWYYGHRNNDSSAVFNYTEYRLVKSLVFVCSDLKGDLNRVFAYGHSMGASGCLTLAERYPSVFSAVYCSQPATDWANTAFTWNADALKNYGNSALNLPIYNIPFNDPAHPELDANLQRYNGTPVYEWQNVREQLIVRAEADMALVCATHGTSDDSIDWLTQGAPFGPVLRDSRRPFKYIVNSAMHNWQGFNAVNFSQLFSINDGYEYGRTFTFRSDVSMPGFSQIESSNTLVSATWTLITDEQDTWEMNIQGVGEVCDITPRRCQAFYANSGDLFNVYVDNTLVHANVAADAAGLVTATDVNLTSTHTVKIESSLRNALSGTVRKDDLPCIQVWPNPFNPTARISIMNIPGASGDVALSVYDVRGKLVKDFTREIRRHGPLAPCSVIWDAQGSPSGTFIVRGTVNAHTMTRKVTFLK